ncbi:MAG: DUF1015 domain-containing protein [Desulfobacteraceae bacterium]|nr:DUF1015 domain-containing protein [Desulfobacteraceae bacterium]MCF8095123.1 DUF1015 domain-containing protein [Desulfobacteraceae bacterium]
MAEILPFKGIRYNPDKIDDLSKVVTPPYDVISEEEQEAYYRSHPYNVIRLDKAKETPQDSETDNPYTRAAADFEKWLKEGVLIRDKTPGFYLTSVNFELEGKPVTRFGLIGTVRLEPFESGIILPHEETFSKVKSERLELMKACHANFSHIFSVYSDKDNILSELKTQAQKIQPEAKFTDDSGHFHRMWKIEDPELCEKITAALKDRRLFIADGHHRYETALNYREWVRENTPDFDENHPANFIMMYLCAVEDQGLVILPTHRLLPEAPESARKKLLDDSKTWFDIETFEHSAGGMDKARQKLSESMINRHRRDHVIGVAMKDEPAYYALILKSGVMRELFEGEISEPLQGLDVTVLTRLILMKLMGFDKKSLDDHSLIGYTSNTEEAAESVAQGEYDIAFILNPPTNEQVRIIAEAGLTMPRKTTFYYPKAITGQVMNKLSRD